MFCGVSHDSHKKPKSLILISFYLHCCFTIEKAKTAYTATAMSVLTSLALAMHIFFYLAVFLYLLCSQRASQFSSLCAFSATWKTAIGLPLRRPSGEALIGAQQEISENSGFWHISCQERWTRKYICYFRYGHPESLTWKKTFFHQGLKTCWVPFSLLWTRSSVSAVSMLTFWSKMAATGNKLSINTCATTIYHTTFITFSPTRVVQINSVIYSLSSEAWASGVWLTTKTCRVIAAQSSLAAVPWRSRTCHRGRKRWAWCWWRRVKSGGHVYPGAEGLSQPSTHPPILLHRIYA